jgi:putative tricarboxylic transport membrane protein
MRLLRNPQALLAGLLLVVAAGYLWMATRMPLGTPALPGPGPFPIAVGAIVAALSLALLLQTARERVDREPVLLPAGEPGRRVVGVWLAVAAYAGLVTTVGHTLMTGLISVAILRLLGMRRWGIVLGLAAGLALSTHYLFVVVFEVPLPEGWWMP